PTSSARCRSALPGLRRGNVLGPDDTCARSSYQERGRLGVKVRTAVIGVVGLALIGWAIAAPRTAPYLFGLLLLSGALVDWLVHRPGPQPGATGAQRMRRVGAGGVGVLVLLVGVGLPLGLRYVPSTAGVLWRSQ